jgi:hypothetical protein
LRLATVGNAVLEGDGLAVSVGRGATVTVSVGIIDAVCVGVRAGTVLVGTLVAIAVGEIGVEVSVQASENITTRIKRKRLRLINGIFAPLDVIYLRNREAKRDLRSSKMTLAAGSAKIGLLANFPIQWENYKKSPFENGDMRVSSSSRELYIVFSRGVVSLSVFFFCQQCL